MTILAKLADNGYSAAIISTDNLYRYSLFRKVQEAGRRAVFIMVNPSTADASQDDATIRKLRGFSERNGITAFEVVNCFAYRATDVAELKAAMDPIGPDNNVWIERAIKDVDLVIYAWGPLAKLPPRLRDRWRKVHSIVTRDYNKTPMCLGVAADGHPRHPLMLGYSAKLVPWSPK